MTPNPSEPRPSAGQHLATVSHDGRFWEVYLEFEDTPRGSDRYRALLAFSPVDRGSGEETMRTIPLLIEESYEEVLQRARRLDEHQLSAMLRSLLP
ncbi:MAG: hypothetical protein EA350_03450 [Gemmatimonadales bacterium]|nr:MAG: hypothetical protein EA350_03450 [Gemmatimonadales bacterium]